MDRRDFLRTAGGVAGGAAAATAAAGTAAAQEGGGERPVMPDYLSDANDQGYEDHRGESDVTVEVGAGGEGLAFGPTLVWVDEGTEVTWEWTGEGGAHNVVANAGGDFRSGDPVDNEGETFTHAFESGGMAEYYCSPHEDLGMKGAVAVGEGVETESTGGGGGEVDPEEMGVPFHPHYVGVSTIVMMVVSLLFTFFLLKYGESPHASGGNN
jgi:halocyanin-like protein